MEKQPSQKTFHFDKENVIKNWNITYVDEFSVLRIFCIVKRKLCKTCKGDNF